MNATDSLPAWSRRRWVLCILLIIAAQVGFICWFSERRVVLPHIQVPQPSVRLIFDRSGPRAGLAPTVSDPTLFALVNAQSFSRSAWLTVNPFPYRMTNQAAPSHPLDFSTEELVDDFAEFVQTNLMSSDRIDKGLLPVLARPNLAHLVVVNTTVLRPAGGLTGQPWVSDQPLPQQPEPILTNSIVRVVVNSAGAPISAALLSSSGSVKADQDALRFARTVRFPNTSGASTVELTNRVQFTSGILIFQWRQTRWIEPSTAMTAKR